MSRATSRTARRWTIPGLLVVLAIAGSAIAYFALAPKTPALQPVEIRPEPAEASSEEVHKLCAACHAYPPADSFPRSAWRKEVKQGYDFFYKDASHRFDYPSLESVVRYYEKRAPEALPPLTRESATQSSKCQFDAGMRAGTGDYLFVTESHCMPAPDCLEAMDKFLNSNSHLAGACCESVPAWENAYQRIDAATFEEGYRLFLQTNDWRKLSVHGMALRRDAFLAVGGMQHQYGRFAEMLLAAALRDSGNELGYARESVVTHHYRETLQEIIDGTDEYVRSECSYREANPGPDRVGHSYFAELSNPFSPGAAALTREVAATLLKGTLGDNTFLKRKALVVASRAIAQLLGRRGPDFSAWLAVAACRLQCWRNRHDAARVDAPYRELIRLVSILSRTRHLATQPVVDPPLPPASREVVIDTLPEWALFGFHGLERFRGESFRWSGPLAAMRLPLVKGQYRLRLITRDLRGERVTLRVAFNGTRIETIALPNGDFELPIGRWHCWDREQTLIWSCEPLRPWKRGVKDYRELGIPLFRVEANSASEGVARPARAA